jgi:hypothetical protein
MLGCPDWDWVGLVTEQEVLLASLLGHCLLPDFASSHFGTWAPLYFIISGFREGKEVV